MPRRFCFRCHKPGALCLCEALPRVRNRTAITIVQHPRERFHPIGTARIARLALERVSVHLAWLDRQPPVLPADAALLFPGEDVPRLDVLAPEERPRHLVVLDGTWPHARAMYRQLPWLHDLPKVCLAPRHPTNYRIRRAPRAEFISTIEAIAQALRCTDANGDDADRLLRAFDTMIDRQIEARRTAADRPRRQRPRRRISRALPPELSADDLIVVYGEGAAPTRPADRPAVRRSRPADNRLIQWAAVRLRDGACLDHRMRPVAGSPGEAHLRHMGLSADDLQHDPASLVDRWRAFAGDGAVVAAWNQSTLDLGHRTGLRFPRHVLLKAVYCNVHRGRSGALEQALRVQGLQPDPLPIAGRAAARLAGAVAMIGHLRALAPARLPVSVG